MASFLIISQNPVLAELIQRNLAKRNHQVDVRIVGQMEQDGSPTRLPARDDSVLVLDLDWFDARLKGQYQTLAWLCQLLGGPRVVLADESWSHRWLQSFLPALLLAKPFSMGSLIPLLEGAASHAGGPLPFPPALDVRTGDTREHLPATG